ncbi:MAG: DUF4276 family protein [Spirochaetaceae bacterium]|nr:DUF4276 family protein [Spirochaetaceae bacterium]
MVGLKIYVEGGGDAHILKRDCRRGFSEFLEKAGLKGCMPRVIACGGRRKAYDDFCTAIGNNESAMLLVDSESPVDQNCCREKEVSKWDPWQHLADRQGDGWVKPDNTCITDCHLMVQCMETWFLADRKALKSFYGTNFSEKALPAKERSIETIDKQQVYQTLENATKNSKKGSYDKGKHSFELLASIDPACVISASPWAKHFIDEVKKKQGIGRV